MYYYIKTRKKGSIKWKALREKGRILIFNKCNLAEEHATTLKDFIYKITALSYHPGHKKSPIYRKRYKKVNW